jgi:hypothetical protein
MALALVASFLVLSACDSAELTTYSRPEGSLGHLAQTIGRLEVDGSCLYLALENGGRTLLVWPEPGTEWTPSTQTVILDGISARVGDRVSLGGGFFPPPDDISEWANPPDPDCWQESRWLVTVMQNLSQPPD